MRNGVACVIDYVPALRVEDVRRALGGRKAFNRATACDVTLPDGRTVSVETVAIRGNLGSGYYRLLRCPACGRACRVLRIMAEGVGCAADLLAHGARYRCQIVRKEMS